MFTIREHRGSIAGLTVTLVGDILRSRVARSNIWGLTKLGARVIVCGPATLIPPHIEQLGVEVSESLDDVLAETDCINMLRVQFERQRGALLSVDRGVRPPVRDERRATSPAGRMC
ncbi:MAG: hypothetical protein R3B90_16015 [Planctomycetaceae bacterium]